VHTNRGGGGLQERWANFTGEGRRVVPQQDLIVNEFGVANSEEALWNKNGIPHFGKNSIPNLGKKNRN